jgi:hypothetical protein
MSAARALPRIFGFTSTEEYDPSGSRSSTGSVRSALTRHSSAAPESAAVHQSAQLKKFRSAISSQSSSSRRYSLRASDCSPAPLPATPPIAASTTACEAHSLMLTTRTFGYAGLSCPSAPAPANPNAAAFSLVSGASHSNPPVAISRQFPRNAPAVSSSATGAATWENSSLMGSYPSRWRAWVIPPDPGTLHDSSQQPHAVSVSVSRAATSS